MYRLQLHTPNSTPYYSCSLHYSRQWWGFRKPRLEAFAFAFEIPSSLAHSLTNPQSSQKIHSWTDSLTCTGRLSVFAADLLAGSRLLSAAPVSIFCTPFLNRATTIARSASPPGYPSSCLPFDSSRVLFASAQAASPWLPSPAHATNSSLTIPTYADSPSSRPTR